MSETPISIIESTSLVGGSSTQRLLIFEDRIELHNTESAESTFEVLSYDDIAKVTLRSGTLLASLLITGEGDRSVLIENVPKTSARSAKELIENRIAPDAVDPFSLSLQKVSDVLTLFTPITGVILYPLGFLALCLQIWRDPEFPSRYLFTAWLAASYVPFKTVLGTAAHILILSLAFSYVGWCLSMLVLPLLQRLGFVQREMLPAQTQTRMWSWVVKNSLIVVGLPLIILLGTPFVARIDPSGWDFLLLPLAGVLSIGVGLFVGYQRIKHRGGWFWRGLAVTYGIAVVAALLFAAVEYPALPRAEFYPPKDRKETHTVRQRRPEMFQLLGFSEGRWYGYNRLSGMMSIPEDEVGTTLMSDAAVDRYPVSLKSPVPTGAMLGQGQTLHDKSTPAAQDVNDFFVTVDGRCIDTTTASFEKQRENVEAVVSCSYGYVDADFVVWPSMKKMNDFYSLLRSRYEKRVESDGPWYFPGSENAVGRKLEYRDPYDRSTIFWTYKRSDKPMSGIAVYRNIDTKDALFDWWYYQARYGQMVDNHAPVAGDE